MKPIKTDIHSDKNSPAFYPPSYLRGLKKLNFVEDMWYGRSSWFDLSSGTLDGSKAELYLPKETGEKAKSYLGRIKRAYFSCRFRRAIEGYAAALTRMELEGTVPESLKARLNNIDLLGNSIDAFFRGCDEMALRDERCFILVEFPARPLIESYEEEQMAGLYPYLVRVSAKDLINKRIENGALTQVTIAEVGYEAEGDFGESEFPQYRVITPQYSQVFKEADEKGNTVLLAGEPYSVRNFNNEPLSGVPLIGYSLTSDLSPFCGEPPLFDLAEMNLQLYQKVSEKTEILHKCNYPFLQVNYLNPSYSVDETGDPLAKEEIQIGMDTVLTDVDCKFIEPTGNSVTTSIEDIKNLEAEMDRQTLGFLNGLTASTSATQAALQSASPQTNLLGWAKRKESAIEAIMELWVAWTGEVLPEDFRVRVNPSLTEDIDQTGGALDVAK